MKQEIVFHEFRCQTNLLRDDFFEAKVDYKVVKNTLIKRALESAGEDGTVKFSQNLQALVDSLKGPTGVIFAYDDPVSPAKILKKHFDKLERPKLKVAVIENETYEGKRLNELASLLSKPQIIAAILGSLDAPISGIVGSINAVFRDLASVIEEVSKKQNNQ